MDHCGKNMTFPPGTILSRKDIEDAYSVVVTPEQAMRYLQSTRYPHRQQSHLAEFEQRKKKIAGAILIYTPGSEIMQKPQLPFHFVPSRLEGYTGLSRQELNADIAAGKESSNKRRQAICTTLESFLNALEQTSQ